MIKVKILFLGFLIGLIPLQAQDASSVAYSSGITGELAGTGLYLRFYDDNRFWQIAGIYDYENDSNSSNPKYTSLGLSYGIHLHENPDAIIPYGLFFHLGGGYTNNKGLETATGDLGLGLQFFNPLQKGLMIEYIIDFGGKWSTRDWQVDTIGFFWGFTCGYNF